jgi:hypothetical protein
MLDNLYGSSVSQFNVKCWAVLGLVRLWLGIHYSYVKGLLMNHATTFLWIVELNELLMIFFSALIVMNLIYFNHMLSSEC